jgi:hypothetical protein
MIGKNFFIENKKVKDSNNNLINVKIIELNGYQKCYFTLNLNSINDLLFLFETYDEFIKLIKSIKIDIIYEKVFGNIIYKEKFEAERKNLFKKINSKLPPCSYIHGLPVNDVPISSIFIFGVSSDKKLVNVQYKQIFKDEHLMSSIVSCEEWSSLYINGIRCNPII